MTEWYKYRGFLPLNGRIHSNPRSQYLSTAKTLLLIMSSSTELKARLEAARVEQERREQETREQEEQETREQEERETREQEERETHEQEERELQGLMEEEERREEENRARREQQRSDEEKKRAEEEVEAQRKAEEEQVAGEERQKTTETEGGEGSREVEPATEVAGPTDETWEEDVARLHAVAMAGSEEEYQATDETCWNCRHQKLVCERPE